MSYATPAYLAYCEYITRTGKRFTWIGYGLFRKAWLRRQQPVQHKLL